LAEIPGWSPESDTGAKMFYTESRQAHHADTDTFNCFACLWSFWLRLQPGGFTHA
jgi:hypothetical protein